MEIRQSPTNQPSSPAQSTILPRTSKNKIPTKDLTTIIQEQEANIHELNLRLSKMEQRTKDIENSLMRVDAMNHRTEFLDDEVEVWVDESIDTVKIPLKKHQRSVDVLGKQENMYRALGINPVGNGL
ncbi:hypothetical protein EYC80_000860 [Monilinia laxa]|uniref:Uncharacterized protein n=1 Tax=Monilinia laxa TaxID=61186 RepID=A0A5N6K7I7_MONLA|nr:hypothetical protein EYC80_000860 [Monilinia laxa]